MPRLWNWTSSAPPALYGGDREGAYFALAVRVVFFAGAAFGLAVLALVVLVPLAAAVLVVVFFVVRVVAFLGVNAFVAVETTDLTASSITLSTIASSNPFGCRAIRFPLLPTRQKSVCSMPRGLLSVNQKLVVECFCTKNEF